MSSTLIEFDDELWQAVQTRYAGMQRKWKMAEPEASETLRGLIDAIVLIPEGDRLRIELKGNLAAMLTAAQKTKRSPETGDLPVPIQMVARR